MMNNILTAEDATNTIYCVRLNFSDRKDFINNDKNNTPNRTLG